MTDLSTADALMYAKDHAMKAWYLFARERNFKAVVPDWRTGVSPDGSPTLSVEVVGPGAPHALRLFTSGHPITLGEPGDQRPGFDYSTTGRVTCVWRRHGVWIELWHPDATVAAPEPAISPSRPSLRRTLTRPGGRLPFTRKQRTTNPKETTTR
jgi:hypothetical protein